jgi:hypothetical protein
MRGQGSFGFNQMLTIVLAIIGFVIFYGLYSYFADGGTAIYDNMLSFVR